MDNLKKQVDIMEIFQNKKCINVCAPMVRYSKLQFRSLVRKYNCDLCFTPMILADSFCLSDKARQNEFTTNIVDTPLITQFAANTVHDFVGAATIVSPYCDGVDLNCGCPQRWAKQLGLGCSMLEKPQLIADLVRQCRNKIPKPFTVSVKMRLLQDARKTVEVCRQLEKAGVSFLTVHARTPSQLTGSINKNVLQTVVDSVSCPIIGNGDLKTLEDCERLREDTGCKGVMVANGILTNPTIFSAHDTTTIDCVQSWLDICYNSTLTSHSYKNQSATCIPEKPPNLTFQCFHHHLVFMLEKVLSRAKRQVFNNLQKFDDVLGFLENEFGLVPRLFDFGEFEKSLPLDLRYDGADEVYLGLRNKFIGENWAKNGGLLYDYEKCEGKFFKSKVKKDYLDCDLSLSDMFIEDD